MKRECSEPSQRYLTYSGLQCCGAIRVMPTRALSSVEVTPEDAAAGRALVKGGGEHSARDSLGC